MKLERRVAWSLSALALGGLFLVACQETTSSEDSGPMAAYAGITLSDISRAPDSIAWKTKTDSGYGKPRCDSLDCTDTLSLAHALGSDTVYLSLWALEIRGGIIPYTQSGRSPYLDPVNSAIVRDDLDLRLLRAFHALRQSKLDSLTAFGALRSDLVYCYARYIFSQDTGYKGFPTTHPIGMSVDSVEKALVYWAAKSSKSWGQLVALGVGLSDSASIHAFSVSLFSAGKLAASDTSALFPVGAKDTIAPTVTSSTGDTFTVPYGTDSTTLKWTVRDNRKIATILLDGASYPLDTVVNERVALAVGTNAHVLIAIDSAGNVRCDTVVVTRLQDTVKVVTFSDTVTKLRSGSFKVRLACATSGAAIYYTLDGTTPTTSSNLYSDSVTIDSTRTLTARAVLSPLVASPVSSVKYTLAVVVDVRTAATFTLIRMSDNTLWGLGDNSRGQLGSALTESYTAIPVKITDSVVDMAIGGYHTLVLRSSNRLYAVGSNDSGQYGNSTKTNSAELALVRTNVVKIAARSNSSLILMADGTLLAAGENQYGQLGGGISSALSTPRVISDSVADMEMGNAYVEFVKKDGSLWAVGYPYNNSLGISLDTLPTTPVKILGGISALSTSPWTSSLVKTTTGAVYVYGGNGHGELGLGTTTDVVTPVLLSSAANSISMSVGSFHSLFVSIDGVLYGMGDNECGQIGANASTTQTTPVQIATGVLKCAAGYWYSLFIKTDGTLWGIGGKRDGGWGTPDNAVHTTPQRINF